MIGLSTAFGLDISILRIVYHAKVCMITSKPYLVLLLISYLLAGFQQRANGRQLLG